jgi:hypothetical protein
VRLPPLLATPIACEVFKDLHIPPTCRRPRYGKKLSEFVTTRIPFHEFRLTPPANRRAVILSL